MKADRKCADCAVCCVIPSIPEFKASHTPCSKLGSPGWNRCTIYGQEGQPSTCREFRCMWLDGHFGSKDRPNNIGVMFTVRPHEAFGTIILAHESVLGASKTGRAKGIIDRLARGLVLYIIPADDGPRTLVCTDPKRMQRVRDFLRSKGTIA